MDDGRKRVVRMAAILGLMAWAVGGGCVGSAALHQAVLSYDDTVSRLEQEILLLNIARMHADVPPHFTVTSSIAATFNFSTTAGFNSTVAEAVGTNSYGFTLGATVAENPTFSIVPVQGEEFTRRILTPTDETKFEFLVFQGAPIDMVLRLMADGIEVQTRDGRFERFVLNRPRAEEEYQEFRQRASHLAWLNGNRNLFVSSLSFEETLDEGLPGPPSPGDLMSAVDKGYQWTRAADGTYALTRTVIGRVAVTNYDPRTLGDAERRALNQRAAKNPRNFVFVDIRPDQPGGTFPLSGAIKLRSLNMMLEFIAEGIALWPEFDVPKDPRTGDPGRNPARLLAIHVDDHEPDDDVPYVAFGGEYFAVGDTPWDRDAFGLLYQLFQMTVTDVSRVGVPITISK